MKHLALGGVESDAAPPAHAHFPGIPAVEETLGCGGHLLDKLRTRETVMRAQDGRGHQVLTVLRAGEHIGVCVQVRRVRNDVLKRITEETISTE